MFVYVYWPKSGTHVVQAFHKVDRAVDFVISQLHAYCNAPNPPAKKKKTSYARGRAAEQGQPRVRAVAAVDPNIFWAQAPVAFADLAPPMPVGGLDLEPPMPVELIAQPPIDMGDADKTMQPKENISQELTKLHEHILVAKKEMTFDNAVKAIELYEEYSKYVLGRESALHTLQAIKIAK
jgi:hypothetical protein